MMSQKSEGTSSILDFEKLPPTTLWSKEELCKEFELEKCPLFVAAPMVRYSNYPFRKVVKDFGADVLYTPMLYAKNLVQSYRNRSLNWGWNLGSDFPILQLAASNGEDFAEAVEMAHLWTSGIDLNCGCPKSNVRKLGCGSILLKTPERIADIIKQGKSRLSTTAYPFSVKLRILDSPEKTVEMCRMLEKAGIDNIALHIRTVEMGGSGPTKPEVAALVKSAIKIPLYINGGVRNLLEVFELAKETNADGIMVANGLLYNPALFAGYDHTPMKAVDNFIDTAIYEGMPQDIFHQHLMFMLRFILGKRERQNFNHCSSIPHILEFLHRLGFDQGGNKRRPHPFILDDC
uniref:DUS-like FMN-binding domain-containing protein n=1 Tax=Panagrolaimus sp. PS1159 TaxID=55785 RepID=A0AC35FA62_9BILA